MVMSSTIIILFLFLIVCYIVAWVLTMTIVIQAAKDKGYSHLSGKLWFIGFFGLIFTPAIIVAALPDKASGKHRAEKASLNDELPAL